MSILKYKASDGTWKALPNVIANQLNVLQTTGTSTTDVMSQKAVTDELALKLPVSDFNSYSGTVDTAINNKASQSDLNTFSGIVTAHTADTDIHVTTADKTAWNNKVDDSDLVDFFDDAKYELSGTTHVINLYHGNTVKATIDASDFIVDGMISGVTLESKSGTTYLVIEWNTDAGIQTTELNIGDIFEADNYYTKSETSGKTEISTALGTKVNSATYTAHTADTSAHFSGDEKENLDSLATNIAAISGITATKVGNWDTAYTNNHTHSNKSALDAITGNVGTMAYENASSYSSATEVNSALEGKQDVITAGSGITITDNEISVDDTVALADATYPGLTAGNIIGEFSDTGAEFAYRPTAGAVDIESGQADYGARLERIKGNTVEMNQKFWDGNFHSANLSAVHCTVSVENGILTNTHDEGDTWSQCYSGIVGHVIGHKYYTSIDLRLEESGGLSIYVLGIGKSYTIGTEWTHISFVGTSIDYGYIVLYSLKSYQAKRWNVIDLTLIYGAGNEPTTPEAFEADYQKWFGKPLTYEEYDEGSLRNVKMTGIKTVGFNLYDGNPIKVLGSTEYQITGTYTSLSLDGTTITPDAEGKFTPGTSGTLTVTGGNATTCVHFVHSGAKDDEFESYWESTLNVPVTTLKGKLNGTGSSVTVFPDGMKKAGTVYDEIVRRGDKTYAIKRVGSVYGAPSRIEYYESHQRYVIHYDGAPESVNMLKNASNGCSNLYIQGDSVNVDLTFDGLITYLYIKDSSLNGNINSLHDKLENVIFFYELATYEEYLLDDFELPNDYDVDDWGTEEILLGTNGCAPILDLKYGINAGDTIKNLSHNYVSAVGEQNFTEAQKARARRNIDAASATATTLAGYGITDAYTKDDLTGTSAVTVAKASSASTASSLSTSTASTVAANDFILLESANGTPVRISRDSFVQAMASVLNSNSQSTISQLFGADANGNHAAINTDNLKTLLSVPSGFRYALISDINAEDKTTIPNSDGPGVLFYEYGEILSGPIIFKTYHIFDKTCEAYGGRILHIKRETAGANVVFVQEGSGAYYGGNFIFIPLRGA